MICLLSDNYVAGIGPGGITDIYEAKILICYLLNAINEPLTRDLIDEIFEEDNHFVNYYTYVHTINELIKSKHLTKKNSDNDILENSVDEYIITAKGRIIAGQLESVLPRSLRDNVVNYAIKIRKEIRMKKYKDITVERVNDGYIIKLAIHDIGSDILRLELFAADKEQVKIIYENFLNNATAIYKGILALSTKDSQWFEEVFLDLLS